MQIVASHDRRAILNHIEQLGSLQLPVFGIIRSETHPEQDIRASVPKHGKASLVVPFANPPGSGFKRFGTTEIAGTSVVPDFRAHRDTRRSYVLNVHHVDRGPVIGMFGLLPDELHNEDLDLLPSFDELKTTYDVETVRAETGMTLCFLGGVATHGFESVNDDRLSVIQSFEVTDLVPRSS